VDQLHDLQRDFVAHLDILVVYILEAHAADEWPIPLGVNKPNNMKQTHTVEERIDHAKKFIDDFDFKVQMMVDGPHDEFMREYHAWPERWILVSKGVISWLAEPSSSVGFRLAPSDLRLHLTNLQQNCMPATELVVVRERNSLEGN